jgi:hypothetical protein
MRQRSLWQLLLIAWISVLVGLSLGASVTTVFMRDSFDPRWFAAFAVAMLLAVTVGTVKRWRRMNQT